MATTGFWGWVQDMLIFLIGGLDAGVHSFERTMLEWSVEWWFLGTR